jgi:hypothetical protein
VLDLFDVSREKRETLREILLKVHECHFTNNQLLQGDQGYFCYTENAIPPLQAWFRALTWFESLVMTPPSRPHSFGDLCAKCFTQKSKGVRHIGKSGTAVENLQKIVSENPKLGKAVAANSIKILHFSKKIREIR